MLYVSNLSFVIPPYLAKKRLYYTINRLIAVILLKPEIQIKICDTGTQITNILVFFLKKIYTLIGDNMELSKLKEEYNQLKNNLNQIGRSL